MTRDFKYSRNRSRVILRQIESTDEIQILELARLSRTLHKGFVSPPLNHEQFVASLKRWLDASNRCYLVCQRVDQRVVGVFNLSQIFLGVFRSAYLGYYVHAKFAGKGYMSEGLKELLVEAFKNIKLHRIEANIQPHNRSSIALVARAGFTREGYSRRYLKIAGRWRDHERWALLVEDWRAASGSNSKQEKVDSPGEFAR